MFICVSMALPARADDPIRALTEANIKDFIENTTDVTTGNSHELSAKKIAEYLDLHVDDKAVFKSLMKYNIPGMPPQEASLHLNKDQFMSSVTQGAEKVEGYETLVEIDEIKISSNGEKAFVKTTNTEYATMPIPSQNDGDAEEVPIEGVSKCTQILSLHHGAIQMFSANCVTEVNFLEY